MRQIIPESIIAAAEKIFEKYKNGNKSSFVCEMKDLLKKNGFEIGGSGIDDITSNACLSAIFRTNRIAQLEYARLKNRTLLELNMYPAYRFEQTLSENETVDWQMRWKAKGGTFYNGEMIALKTSDIWTKISDYSRPYAPFSFGSEMICRDVRREDCVKLGIINPLIKFTKMPPLPLPPKFSMFIDI